MNSPPSADSKPRQVLRQMGVDRAVGYAVMLRAWQFVGGSASTLLIALIFTKNQQGFYYVFANVLAMQAFFELGFNIVVSNTSSHEWAKLSLDSDGRIQGDARAFSRLISLGRLIFRWYAIAATGFILIVGAAGLWFFANRPDADVIWREPWCLLVVSTGLMLWTLPYNAMLEGCNRVASVNRFRVIQAILGNIVVWVVLLLGGGLWAVVASSWTRLCCELVFLLVGYRSFFKPFFSPPPAEQINWRSELWPMQWRLGISGAFSYFALNMFGLVMFHYHNPAVAGQMGMTWTLASVVQAASLAWVQTKTPIMGGLISEGKFEQLDRLFFRLSAASMVVMCSGAMGIWLGIHGLAIWWPALANRLLDPTSALILVMAFVVMHFPHCQAFYIRAHKRDNLLAVSVVSSIAIGLLVWILGARFGPIGAASGFLAVAIIVVLPFQTAKWLECRRNR